MNTRLFVIPLALIVAVGVTACGSSSDNPPTPPTAVTGQVSATGGGALDEYCTLLFDLQGSSAQFEVGTNAAGQYARSVPAGTYDVTASRPGYETLQQNNFDVVGQTINDLDVALVPIAGVAYIGSTNCAVCHEDYFDDFIQSAHPYKISKIVNDQPPSFPFQDPLKVAEIVTRIADTDDAAAADMWPGTENALSTPSSYADISYMIGGYFWKSRFIDLAGWIVTGDEVQYNWATDEMVSYHNNEPNKPFNCGNCHTTGWRHYDAGLNPARQDGLDGMDGTFAFPGIQCESCHGAGNVHAQTMSAGDITETAVPRTIAQLQAPDAGFGLPVACKECHTRDGERDYSTYMSNFDNQIAPATTPVGGRIAASGGLVRHHEQGDEIKGINPDTDATVRSVGFQGAHGNCMTCHGKAFMATGGNIHGSVVYGDDAAYTGPVAVRKDNAWCMNCHADNDPSLRAGGMTGLNCIDCHMPKMAKSAVATTLGNGVVIGDVTSHIFSIDVGVGTPQFNGGFAYPWITVDFACRTCHGNDGLFDVSESDTFVFHNNK